MVEEIEENDELAARLKAATADPIKRLIIRLNENAASIRIARVPRKTAEEFIRLADSEFCSDYGFTLKWLMDNLVSGDMQAVLATLTNHEERLRELKEKLGVQETKRQGDDGVRRMVDGTSRRVKRP